jgi:hypothetical protein
MTGFKYYVSKDQAKILKTESIRLGVDVADLIKMRLEQAATEQNLNDIQQILESRTVAALRANPDAILRTKRS